MLQNKIGDLIWNLQLSPRHVNELNEGKTFWHDVLRTWANFVYKLPENVSGVKKQMLWFNSNICIKNKPVCYSSWSKKGINFIEDLIDVNNRILSLEEMIAKYGHIEALDFFRIISVIPKEWKKTIKQ